MLLGGSRQSASLSGSWIIRRQWQWPETRPDRHKGAKQGKSQVREPGRRRVQAAVGPGRERGSRRREGLRGCAHRSPPEGSVVAPVERVPLDLEASTQATGKGWGTRLPEEEAVFSFEEEGGLRTVRIPGASHSS